MAGADDENDKATAQGVPDALDQLLQDSPADEKAGANASLGFAYQHWWGALAVVDLLASNDDFAVGMEVKEDVVILDSAVSPTAIEFCQVKKNETAGGWKLADLHREGRTRADKTKDPSPLAKLYKRRNEFSGHPTKLRFVSNLGVKVGNDDGSESIVFDKNLEDRWEKDRQILCKQIGKQLNKDASEVQLNSFAIHRTNLPMGEQHIFLAGKLVALCESGSVPFPIPEPTVAARVLASVLQGKANNTAHASNFTELKERIISRAQAMDLLVQVAKAKKSSMVILDEALERLNHEGHNYFELEDIKAERASVLAHASDRTNAQFQRIAASLFEFKGGDKPSDGKLGTYMKEVSVAARLVYADAFLTLSPGYIYCACLLVVCNAIDIDVLLVAADKKPEAQA